MAAATQSSSSIRGGGGRSFLDLLPPADRARLMALCHPVTYAFGEVMVREGEEAGAMFILVGGRARVVQQRDDDEEIILATLQPGDVFGEISLLQSGTRTATVRASTSVTALRLDRDRFETLLAEQPELETWLDNCSRARVLFNFLRSVHAFQNLPVPVLQGIMECLRPIEVESGDVLIREGDPPGPMYLIDSGRLRVRRSGDDHREKNLAYLRSGDVFGELSLVHGQPRIATVEAVSAARLYVLDADSLRALLDRSPELRHAVEERAATYDFEREARVPLDFAIDAEPATPPPQLPGDDQTESARQPAPAEAPETAPQDERSGPFATATGLFEKRKAGRRFPFLYQVDEMDCGAACLAMVCRHFGRRVSLSRIRALAHTATDGTTLRNLCRAAEELGLAARSVKVSRRNLDHVPAPAIIHWENYHWVVLVDVRHSRVRVADPAIGDRWLPRAEFESKWNGYAGLFDYTDAFADAPQETRTLAWMRPFVRPFAGVLAKAFGLAVIAASLMLVLPVLTQVVVDRVIVDGAMDLLNMVLLAMGVTFVFYLAANTLQGYLLAFVAVRVDASAFDFLTRKLLALPMSYFHARRTGDIQRRLDSARQVRQLLVSSGIAGVLAIVQLCLALLVMLVYSPLLALIYAAVAPLYGALMFFSARFLKPLFEGLEESYGKYRSEQIDAIKGIEAVKAASAEGSFRDQLLNRFLGAARQQFHADLTILIYQGAIQAVGFLTSLLFLWLGARLTMAGQLTLGGFVAFNALVAMANAPIGIFLSLWDDLQLVRVLLNRLADVFEHAPEQGHDRSRLLPVKTISGEIELRGVGFRYGGPEAPAILEDISLKVPAGRMIALVGPSGGGKTTLVKLLSGLLESTEGTILFDGLDQRTLNYRDLRRQIGLVLQDSHLFSGSILENIAFGEEIDLTRAMAAARLGHCHEFIERLPLGYETRVGETGVALSGGQKQRLTIARALYGNPAVLILDEATSALDAESERAIYQNLESILGGRTVFVIAHRLSTIRNADRIVVLDRGRIAEQGTHGELMDRRGIYFYLVSRQVET